MRLRERVLVNEVRVKGIRFVAGALFASALGVGAHAETVAVRHVQRSMHRWMVARSEAGAVLARGEFTQVLEGDEPAVVRIVGQLGGAGPVVSSELEGASFPR
jgi:hypothetical protein